MSELILERVKTNLLSGIDAFYYKKILHQKLQLHLFYPEDYDVNRTNPFPVAVNFHGGEWKQGVIEWAYAEARMFASLGFVGIAVEYRLVDSNTSVINAIKDAKSVVRWCRSYAKELNFNPDKVFSIGYSAGGHLSLSTAMLPEIEEPGENKNISSVPSQIWAYAPAVDIERYPRFEEFLLGCSSLRECSPLANARRMDIPIRIITGDMDDIIPVDTIRRFKNTMIELGNDIKVWEIPGGDHFYYFKDKNALTFCRQIIEKDLKNSQVSLLI